MLSKFRGDINPSDVLTKPKSLEDMKVLLSSSCLDWCDGKVGKNTCRDNRIEFVNSVGNRNTCRDSRIEFVNSVGNNSFEDSGNVSRYCFVNSPTVRRRGGVGVRTVCFGPNPKVPNNPNRVQHGTSSFVESGRLWCCHRGQTHTRAFGSRCMW